MVAFWKGCRPAMIKATPPTKKYLNVSEISTKNGTELIGYNYTGENILKWETFLQPYRS